LVTPGVEKAVDPALADARLSELMSMLTEYAKAPGETHSNESVHAAEAARERWCRMASLRRADVAAEFRRE
jgi:hypothetical protein